MEDLGPPASYLVLAEGTPVHSSDGEQIGNVEHVLGDAETVDRIYERGVVLTIDAAAAQTLPEPSENPAAMEVTGEDFVEREWDDELEAKLKRAWDRISGKGP